MATVHDIKLELVNDLGYQIHVKYELSDGPIIITYSNQENGLTISNAKLCDATFSNESENSFILAEGKSVYMKNTTTSPTTITDALGGISIDNTISLTLNGMLRATINLSTVMHVTKNIAITGGTANDATLTLKGTVNLGGNLTIGDGVTFTSTGSFTTIGNVKIAANVDNSGTFVYNGVFIETNDTTGTIAKQVTIAKTGRLETTTINHILSIAGTLICETIGDTTNDKTINVSAGQIVEIGKIETKVDLTLNESVSGLASLTINNDSITINSFKPGTFSNGSNLTITCNNADIDLSGLTLNGSTFSTFSSTILNDGISSAANQTISLVNSVLICKELKFVSGGTGNAYSLEMANYEFNRDTCVVTLDKNNNVFNGGTGTARKSFTYTTDALLISNFNIGPNASIDIAGTLSNATGSTLNCDGTLTVSANRTLTLNGELNINNNGSLTLANTSKPFTIDSTGKLTVAGQYTLEGEYDIKGTVYLDRNGKIEDSVNTVVNVADNSEFYMNNGQLILSSLGTTDNPYKLNIGNKFICNGTLTADSPFTVTGGFHLTNDSKLTIASDLTGIAFGTGPSSEFYVTSENCTINAPITTNMFRICGFFENNAQVTVNGSLHVTLDAKLTVKEPLEIDVDSELVVNGENVAVGDDVVPMGTTTITENTTLIVNADNEILAGDYAYGGEYKINPFI